VATKFLCFVYWLGTADIRKWDRTTEATVKITPKSKKGCSTTIQDKVHHVAQSEECALNSKQNTLIVSHRICGCEVQRQIFYIDLWVIFYGARVNVGENVSPASPLPCSEALSKARDSVLSTRCVHI